MSTLANTTNTHLTIKTATLMMMTRIKMILRIVGTFMTTATSMCTMTKRPTTGTRVGTMTKSTSTTTTLTHMTMMRQTQTHMMRQMRQT